MIKRFFLGAAAALLLTGFGAQAASHPTTQGGVGIWGNGGVGIWGNGGVGIWGNGGVGIWGN